MDIQYVKVSDSGLHDDVDFKTKRSAKRDISSMGTTHISLPLRPTSMSSIRNPAKRTKLDGRTNMYRSCDFSSGKRLLKYYSNLKKSGPPHRMMYYHNGEWNDFPQEVVTCLKNDFLVKNTATEVDVEGNKNLLDFLHMTKLDLVSGMCQPIAWIDISGKCFFPETVADPDEDEDHVAYEPLKFQDVNLHLEVEVNGLGAFKLHESSGESSAVINQVQAYENSEDEVGDSYARGSYPHIDQKSGKILKMGVNLDSDAVKQQFFRCFSGHGKAEIVELLSCYGNAMEARHELFQKQVEIMNRCRGNANVFYAWLPCSGGTVPSILSYGVGFQSSSKVKPMYGLGVHLIPANGTLISARNFDVDENGTRHMVLCRVIMGNMELISPGSTQFHPGRDEFDSGVDNLQYPKQYVVWNVNINTHIYPERVVSFKLASDFEGPAESVIANSSSAKIPNSPWMPFPVLFAAIANKVTSNQMVLINNYYELLRTKKINRDDLIRKLRSICGDALLRTTITSIRNEKLPMQSQCT